jgi:DnaK suppressor protein
MTKANLERRTSLRQVLVDHQHQIQDDVTERVRASRLSRAREVGDSLDTSDEDVRVGMDFTLLQIKTTMLAGITQALQRLDVGRYGDCAECEEAIPAARLRAVPFAVRCQSCEREREASQRHGVRLEESFGTEAPDALRSPGNHGAGRFSA